jgi:hypothetical protein
VDWYEFIATLKFEFSDFLRRLHEEEEKEYEDEKRDEKIDSEESDSNSNEFE